MPVKLASVVVATRTVLRIQENYVVLRMSYSECLCMIDIRCCFVTDTAPLAAGNLGEQV